MKICKRCENVKFWFQFFTVNKGVYTAIYDVCRKCANEMRAEAVDNYQFKLNQATHDQTK